MNELLSVSGILHSLIAILAIVNPLGAVPVFTAITQDETPEQQQHTARKAAVTMAITLLVSAYFGIYILQFFGINMNSFRVAGGVLIMMMAMNMMSGRTNKMRQTEAEHQEGIAKEDVAVVPLAIPILAGPGAMSTMILTTQNAGHWLGYVFITMDVLIVASIAYTMLRMSMPLTQRIGESGIRIATRILGLILAAIAVQFITQGLIALLPGLG